MFGIVKLTKNIIKIHLIHSGTDSWIHPDKHKNNSLIICHSPERSSSFAWDKTVLQLFCKEKKDSHQTSVSCQVYDFSFNVTNPFSFKRTTPNMQTRLSVINYIKNIRLLKWYFVLFPQPRLLSWTLMLPFNHIAWYLNIFK